MFPYKEYKRIIYEPGRITRIKMNRPRYLNAQSHAMLGELEDAYDRASQDPECRVIVVSGEGRCFSAGDDTNGLTPESAPCLTTDETREELLERFPSESALWNQYNIEHDYFISWWLNQKLLRVPKPTVGMIHGYCIMGAMLHATSLDILFCSEDAMFLGARQLRSMWDMGPRKALELAYEHRYMTAREALESRLVNRVFPDFETLERETLAFAERVAANGGGLNAKQTYLRTLDAQGYSGVYYDDLKPWADAWRSGAASGHAERFEGRGMARSPVAYYNLAQYYLSQGREVPEPVIEALQRGLVRDDREAWRRALNQSGREPERLARAAATEAAWDERLQREGIKDINDRIRDMMESQGWKIPERASE